MIGGLSTNFRHLERGIEDGCSVAFDCRSMMQFSFATDIIFVEFFTPDRLIESNILISDWVDNLVGKNNNNNDG